MSKIQFKCPACGQYMAVSGEHAGQTMECPEQNCRYMITIPHNSEPGAGDSGGSNTALTLIVLFLIIGLLALGGSIYLFVGAHSARNIPEPAKPAILEESNRYSGQKIKFDFTLADKSIRGMWSQSLTNPPKVRFSYQDSGAPLNLTSSIVGADGESNKYVDEINSFNFEKGEEPMQVAKGTLYAIIPRQIPPESKVTASLSGDILYLRKTGMTGNTIQFDTGTEPASSSLSFTVVNTKTYQAAEGEYGKLKKEYDAKMEDAGKVLQKAMALMGVTVFLFIGIVLIAGRGFFAALLGVGQPPGGGYGSY